MCLVKRIELFITDVIVYTYAEFGMNCLKNKLNITHCSECCVGSLLQYITSKAML